MDRSKIQTIMILKKFLTRNYTTLYKTLNEYKNELARPDINPQAYALTLPMVAFTKDQIRTARFIELKKRKNILYKLIHLTLKIFKPNPKKESLNHYMKRMKNNDKCDYENMIDWMFITNSTMVVGNSIPHKDCTKNGKPFQHKENT
jgi:hypothetical protein